MNEKSITFIFCMDIIVILKKSLERKKNNCIQNIVSLIGFPQFFFQITFSFQNRLIGLPQTHCHGGNTTHGNANVTLAIFVG